MEASLVKVSLTPLLNDVVQELNLDGYSLIIEICDDETYEATIEILTYDFGKLEFKGAPKDSAKASEEDAAREAIKTLKDLYFLEIDDVNFSDKEYYHYAFHRVNKHYERALCRIRRLEAKVRQYEDMLNDFNVATEASTTSENSM